MLALETLFADVEQARYHYLSSVRHLSTTQGNFRPAVPTGATWSIAEVTEHLVHAEYGGVLCIWKAAVAMRTGKPIWSGASVNQGLSIEDVVARTWRPREAAPEGAAPRMGGPLGYWVAALSNAQALLPPLIAVLDGLDGSTVIFPHPISGPLDVRQRLEFLRFHLDRHRGQVESIKGNRAFPAVAEDAG